MSPIFAVSCFALAIVYGGGLLLYRRNGPSSVIGRFTYVAATVCGLHLTLGLFLLVVLVAKADYAALTVVAAVLASQVIIAQSLTFKRAGVALVLQILVLTAGGLWLTVVR